ncbi:hypothetical protein NDU88_001455 [Pleurodeles waltl]|uniref:Uncharacterized protein n=1 Tax=Pleurodeles waltl TaxID=8319 RepID=A0AAV7UW47_PLEWA|nr:hypothetical protein NDU88_001455 [Pleurodeles waltl]
MAFVVLKSIGCGAHASHQNPGRWRADTFSAPDKDLGLAEDTSPTGKWSRFRNGLGGSVDGTTKGYHLHYTVEDFLLKGSVLLFQPRM